MGEPFSNSWAQLWGTAPRRRRLFPVLLPSRSIIRYFSIMATVLVTRPVTAFSVINRCSLSTHSVSRLIASARQSCPRLVKPPGRSHRLARFFAHHACRFSSRQTSQTPQPSITAALALLGCSARGSEGGSPRVRFTWDNRWTARSTFTFRLDGASFSSASRGFLHDGDSVGLVGTLIVLPIR